MFVQAFGGLKSLLEKVLSCGLSLFTGPIVESTFSDVQNIITDKRNKITDKTVAALLAVMYAMKADGRPQAQIFPIGVDAQVNKPMVRAVRGAWKVSANKADGECDDYDGNIVWGAPKVTKRKALEELKDSA